METQSPNLLPANDSKLLNSILFYIFPGMFRAREKEKTLDRTADVSGIIAVFILHIADQLEKVALSYFTAPGLTHLWLLG